MAKRSVRGDRSALMNSLWIGLALCSIRPWEHRRVAVHVTRACERRLLSSAAVVGDGFTAAVVFQEEVQRTSYDDVPPGTVGICFGPSGKKALAVGLFDPVSPLRVRVLALGATSAPIDSAWVGRTIARAAAERGALFDNHCDEATTGYRLVNGEHDGLPGLVVDRYGDTLVAKCYSAAWLPWREEVAAALVDACPVAQRVVLLQSREIARLAHDARAGASHGDVLRGAPLPADGRVRFRENGLEFACQPVDGQKTGFFLDQRENRARVRTLVQRAGASAVLNVFAYTGGFSLYAADGGAAAVTSVDLAARAIADCERNWALNAHRPAIRAASHEGVVADAFEAMDRLRADGRRFDLAVVDPPAFAQRERHVPKALGAYSALARAAVQLVEPGGRVLLASCSARVGSDAFLDAVRRGAQAAGRPLRVEDVTGHAADHPVRAHGATPYLKGVFATVP